MGDKTAISWTDATWNPVRGCSRVSEGCRHCYAERFAARFSGHDQPYHGLVSLHSRSGGRAPEARWSGEVRIVPDHLADPLRWRKPRRIFVNSMSDLFHEKLTNEQIAAAFGVMAAAPQHTFQVLTKRAKRMREWFEWVASTGYDPGHVLADALNSISDGDVDERFGNEEWQVGLINVVNGMSAWKGSGWRADGIANWPLPNVWLGVSVENQEAADERIPELLATPAAVRFLSCEPLLGPIDLDRPRCDVCGEETPIVETEGGGGSIPWCSEHEQEGSYGHWLHLDGGIDWVICGCESGVDARPCEVAWLRSLRDQCAEAGVAFFLKQATATEIGTCGDADNPNGNRPCGKPVTAHIVSPSTAAYSCDCTVEGPEDGTCVPVGPGDGSKRKAGGVIELPYLDGVQHAAFPEVAR